MQAYFLNRITIHPDVMVGKPTIRGLRITVEQILKALANDVKMENGYDVRRVRDIDPLIQTN